MLVEEHNFLGIAACQYVWFELIAEHDRDLHPSLSRVRVQKAGKRIKREVYVEVCP